MDEKKIFQVTCWKSSWQSTVYPQPHPDHSWSHAKCNISWSESHNRNSFAVWVIERAAIVPFVLPVLFRNHDKLNHATGKNSCTGKTGTNRLHSCIVTAHRNCTHTTYSPSPPSLSFLSIKILLCKNNNGKAKLSCYDDKWCFSCKTQLGLIYFLVWDV